MRVLFASTSGAGHFGPLVPFAHAIRRAGHDVLVAAPMSAQARVERAGLPFISFADPLELLAFGIPATLRALGHTELRHVPLSPDGGAIADYGGDVGDPAALAARLSATPGVIDHGLFPPELVHDVLIARDGEIEHRE